MLEQGLTIPEADAIMGPAMGRPKQQYLKPAILWA